MSEALVDAINKFIAWEKELVEVTSEQQRDGAERLGVALYGKDDPVKLLGGCNAKIFHDAASKIAELTARLAAADSEIERLQKLLIPSWYWDDRNLESAIPPDEVCEFDGVGDIIKVRPIVELPAVFALVTEDGVEFYDSWDAANESGPNEAAKAGGVE